MKPRPRRPAVTIALVAMFWMIPIAALLALLANSGMSPSTQLRSVAKGLFRSVRTNAKRIVRAARGVGKPAAVPPAPLPGPFPLFPRDNWWNLDVSGAPVDPRSRGYIDFIGSVRRMHPDFGGQEEPGSVAIYGFPYVVVPGTQPKRLVEFKYADESDGVGQAFYPIPDEAITRPHMIEGGQPGNDAEAAGDRHLIIVDRDNKWLYELFALSHDGIRWQAGSGAFFDLKANDRRPEGWTSADAAGLAILPGLVRYDEVYEYDEIGHAFRVSVRKTNGFVFPASHRAGKSPGALPLGARLRLTSSTDTSRFPPSIQKIFRAMKKYGLIVADNGADMFVSGTFDPRWDNDVLNPAFAAVKAGDFEVVLLGWGAPEGRR